MNETVFIPIVEEYGLYLGIKLAIRDETISNYNPIDGLSDIVGGIGLSILNKNINNQSCKCLNKKFEFYKNTDCISTKIKQERETSKQITGKLKDVNDDQEKTKVQYDTNKNFNKEKEKEKNSYDYKYDCSECPLNNCIMFRGQQSTLVEFLQCSKLFIYYNPNINTRFECEKQGMYMYM